MSGVRMDYSGDFPDRRKGGMSEAEKGKGKVHVLHEGEIVLNRPTTKKLLDVLGIAKDTAMKMAPGSLMKRVQTLVDQAKREVDKVKEPSKEGAMPKRRKGGMARASPVKSAPARRKGGMARSDPGKNAPKRQAGGMSAPDRRALRQAKKGKHPQYDQL